MPLQIVDVWPAHARGKTHIGNAGAEEPLRTELGWCARTANRMRDNDKRSAPPEARTAQQLQERPPGRLRSALRPPLPILFPSTYIKPRDRREVYEGTMSIRPVKRIIEFEADPGRGRSKAAAGLRLWRDQRVRSISFAGRFP